MDFQSLGEEKHENLLASSFIVTHTTHDDLDESAAKVTFRKLFTFRKERNVVKLRSMLIITIHRITPDPRPIEN